MTIYHTLLSRLTILLVVLAAACTTPNPNPNNEGSSIQAETAIFALASPTPVRNSTPIASPTVQAISTPSTQEQSSTLPLPTYFLTATLNYNQHLLSVDELIVYTNHASEPIPDLRLMVDPSYYLGVFQLKEISWGSGQPIEDYTVETGQIHIPVHTPLQPGESLSIRLSYDLNLPSPVPSAAVRPIPFGYTERQTNLVDWYPFIPPYKDGEGWLAHQAGFFGEHLVYDLANFEVNIRLEDPPDGLVLAASAPGLQEGEWHRYQHDAARNFAWSASPAFQVFTTQVGNTTVQSYAFPYHASAGEAVLKTTAEALSLYNELYGTYPRSLLTVIEADFLDGMEYDGLYFLSNGFYNLYQGTPGEYLIAIAAHETAHQWFYASVGNDQALEPWLDEALCTYQEHIYFENLYPEALEWWWAYRVNYYEPSGWVNGSIYNPAGYRAYRDAVYLNGAVFLDKLRDEIGEESFFVFLKDYTLKNKDLISTGERFFEILSEHTDKDLSGLIADYFKPIISLN